MRSHLAALALAFAAPSPAAAQALVAAQRGWIAYRDGLWDLAGLEARGGSVEPMLVSACLADLMRKRAKRAEGFIGGGEAQ
jgi:uncharacterized protein YecT (DUF1311 family)